MAVGIKRRGFRQAPAQEVREWAADKGLPYGGSRGRLPKATIEAFDQAHATGKGRAEYSGTPVGVREYTLTGPKGGVKARTTAKGSAVRAWAGENGYEVSERGRIPSAVKEAFVAAQR
jgi:hypothetical protein